MGRLYAALGDIPNSLSHFEVRIHTVVVVADADQIIVIPSFLPSGPAQCRRSASGGVAGRGTRPTLPGPAASQHRGHSRGIKVSRVAVSSLLIDCTVCLALLYLSVFSQTFP